MLSSCSVTSNRRRIHELFVSFRGKDTRLNFVSHLYSALDENGIDTFMDDKELDRGSDIGPTLSQEIQDSRIAVAVFSKNYSDSPWCLDELVEINDCRKRNGLIVYPVFYDVSTSDLKNQTGHFGKAFSVHKDAEKVELWRTALREIGNLSGWDMVNDPAFSNHDICKKSIVKEVNRRLDELPYNIDDNCEHDVGIFGILGIPGSGKTTTARALFNNVCEEFDGRSFVENIGDIPKYLGLVSVQKQILKNVLGHEVEVRDENDGCKKIKRRLSKKKVLIVLDKVDSEKQLTVLIGQRNWFGDGSMIIITTTDAGLLRTHNLVYTTKNVRLLDDKEAIQLLNKCAFQNSVPTEAHKECLQSIIRYAAGHPGILKNLGSKLSGMPIDVWKDTINRLTKCTEAETGKMLESSLEGLDTLEMDLFLDIACFFNGWIKDEVIDILDSCELYPTSGLPILREKSLVTYSRGFIQMHNLVLETGRNIVHKENPDEPSGRSRLWHPEEVKEVLLENKGTKYIKAIVISNLNKLDARAAFDAFTTMRKLRLLHASTRRMVFLLHGSSIDSLQWIMDGHGNLKYLPCDLKWLTWDYFNLESWPTDFHAKKLVGLQMRHSSIVDLCHRRDMKFLHKLQFLDLSFSKELVRTPDFDCLRNLKKLNLECCSSLVAVHPSIRNHSNIVVLNLRCCDKLKSLPSSLEMRSLEVLNLSCCSNLTTIPDFVGMNNLLELDLSNNSIEELPASIGSLPSLKYLDIGNCRNLTFIPQSILMLHNQAEVMVYGSPVP